MGGNNNLFNKRTDCVYSVMEKYGMIDFRHVFKQLVIPAAVDYLDWLEQCLGDQGGPYSTFPACMHAHMVQIISMLSGFKEFIYGEDEKEERYWNVKAGRAVQQRASGSSIWDASGE